MLITQLAPLALALTTLQTGAEAVPGRYLASDADARCRVVLMEPATRPADSLMVAETRSGLAAVEPGCSLAIAGAGLWVLTEASGELALVGMDGQALFAGSESQNAWRGTGPQGEALILSRP